MTSKNFALRSLCRHCKLRKKFPFYAFVCVTLVTLLIFESGEDGGGFRIAIIFVSATQTVEVSSDNSNNGNHIDTDNATAELLATPPPSSELTPADSTTEPHPRDLQSTMYDSSALDLTSSATGVNTLFYEQMAEEFLKDIDEHLEYLLSNNKQELIDDIHKLVENLINDVTVFVDDVQITIEQAKEYIHNNFEQSKEYIKQNVEQVRDQLENDFYFEEIKGRIDSEAEDAIEYAKQQIDETNEQIRKSVGYWRKKIYKDTTDVKNRIKKQVKKNQRLFRRSLMKHVLHQRVGWDRIKNSVRAHLGALVGIWVVLAGYSKPELRHCGCIVLQTAQITYKIIDLVLEENGKVLFLRTEQPWVIDLVVTVVGIVAWKFLPNQFAARSIPPIYLGVLLFQTIYDVLEEWNWNRQVKKKTQGHTKKRELYRDYLRLHNGQLPSPIGNGDLYDNSYNYFEEETPPPLWLTSLLSLITFAFITRWEHIPTEMASSSISGAMLLVQSAKAEIAGNWFYMIEIIVFSIIRPLFIHIAMPIFKWLINPFIWCWNHRKQFKKYNPIKLQENISIAVSPKPLVELYQKKKKELPQKVWVHALSSFVKRLNKALTRVSMPWGFAWFGIGLQMKWFRASTIPGKILDFFQFVINPIKFLLNKSRKMLHQEFAFILKFIGRVCLFKLKSHDSKEKDDVHTMHKHALSAR